MDQFFMSLMLLIVVVGVLLNLMGIKLTSLRGGGSPGPKFLGLLHSGAKGLGWVLARLWEVGKALFLFLWNLVGDLLRWLAWLIPELFRLLGDGLQMWGKIRGR